MKTIVRMIIAISLDMRHTAKFQLIIDLKFLGEKPPKLTKKNILNFQIIVKRVFQTIIKKTNYAKYIDN